jgi:hypothetical protein
MYCIPLPRDVRDYVSEGLYIRLEQDETDAQGEARRFLQVARRLLKSGTFGDDARSRAGMWLGPSPSPQMH